MMGFAMLAFTKAPANYGLFGDYYYAAEQILATMTLDEKIGQVLLAEYRDTGSLAELQQYQFGGYIFFARNFNGKNRPAVQTMIAALQSAAKIPLLLAVDEEGGIVTRVSQNPLLRAQAFASPQAVYRAGGLDLVYADTLQKHEFLASFGLNLNLAPVVDVSTNPRDFMFNRTLGLDAQATADYARTVIEASHKSTVSATLKHFPGYGNNADTHLGAATDSRSYEEIMQNDILPFRAGIAAGAEAVLISHNIVSSIDAAAPASLSAPVHRLLREELNFSGVILTDEITMGALSEYEQVAVRALEAGNDLIITRDAIRNFQEIKAAVTSGALDKAVLDRAALKVIAWKCYKGLI